MRAVIITSSPGIIFAAYNAACNPEVPLLVEIEYLQPIYLLNLDSNNNGQETDESCFFKQSRTFSISIFENLLNELFRKI